MSNEININLETNLENCIVKYCKQNDDIILKVAFYENGLEKDISNFSITIQAAKADRTYIVQNTDILKAGNKISAQLKKDFTRIPGRTELEIVLVDSGKQTTTFTFVIEVRRSVIDGFTPSGDTITALEGLQGQIEAAGKLRQEVEELITTGGAATKGEVQQLNAQLEAIPEQTYITEKAKISYVNEKIANIDRGIGGTYPSLAEIKSNFPNGNNLRYVASDTGMWYFWNGSAWTSGGVFQGMGIADGTLEIKKIVSTVPSNNKNNSALEYGALGTNGALVETTDFMRTSDFITVDRDKLYWITSNNGYKYRVAEYASNFTFVKATNVTDRFTTSSTTSFIKFATYDKLGENDLTTKVMLNTGASALQYETPDNKIPWALMERKKIPTQMANSDMCYLSCIGGKVNVDFQNNQVILPSGDKYVFYKNSFASLPVDEIKISKASEAPILSGLLVFNESTKLIRMSGVTSLNEEDYKIGTIYKGNISLNTSFNINNSQKTFVTFGDSITWYDGNPYGESTKEPGIIVRGYGTFIKEELGYNVINKGASGYDMTQINSIIQTYDFKEGDEVSITSGANDHRKGITPGVVLPIGSAFITTTYAGAIQASIEKILNTNKNIKIYLITPIRGWFNENHTADVPNAYKGEMEVSEEYVEIMKSIGKLYGIPVCDVFNNLGLNVLTRPTLLVDLDTTPYYLHPSTEGYRRYKEKLIPFLENN